MRERFAKWLLDTLGLVPVSEAAEYAEYDTMLRALGINDPAQRARALEGAATLAQAGLTDFARVASLYARFGVNVPQDTPEGDQT